MRNTCCVVFLGRDRFSTERVPPSSWMRRGRYHLASTNSVRAGAGAAGRRCPRVAALAPWDLLQGGR